MGIGGHDLVEQGTPLPGGLGDHDHHPRVVRGRIGAGHSTPMRRQARLERAVFGGPWLLARARPFDQTCRQAATAEMQGAKDRDRLGTSARTSQGPVPFAAQGGTQRWHHGKAGGIWAPQDQLPRLRWGVPSGEVLTGRLLLLRGPFAGAIGGR